MSAEEAGIRSALDIPRWGPNENHGIWCDSTTNFAVTLPSTPADQGEQRQTVTNGYSQVAGMHE